MTKKSLQAIKDRYFRPVIAEPKGMITHHGHCEIYRSIEVYGFAFCSCGLLHDLHDVGIGLAEKVYPNYGKDYKRQENPNGPEPTQEEIDGMQRMLEEAFGQKFIPMPEEERMKQDEEEWNLIADVFGKEYVEYSKRSLTIR